MELFSIVFLVALIGGVAGQIWLMRRQRRHVLAHRAEVPEAFRAVVDLEAHQKAADYTVAKVRIRVVELLFSSLLLIGWTLGGGLRLLDEVWRGLELGSLLTGVGFLISLFFAIMLLEVPASAYRDFVIEERFGFNRSTPWVFIGDMLKGALLTLILGAPLAALVLWLMEKSGSLWWLYVWVVWSVFGLVVLWLYPSVIAPLFNKFTPLEDEALRLRISELLKRCGFTSKGIFVMDGSKRSAHGNAYFSGFGANKRIVFFDTLLNMLSLDEIEAVLAHELGHFRKKHILEGIIVSLATSLVGLGLLGYLIGQDWFYSGLGVDTPSLPVALALFLLVSPVFSVFIEPIMAHFSRKREFEADEFASEYAEATALSSALVKMYQENASTLTPDPLHSAFYDSHPPAPVRIAHLKLDGTYTPDQSSDSC